MIALGCDQGGFALKQDIRPIGFQIKVSMDFMIT